MSGVIRFKTDFASVTATFKLSTYQPAGQQDKHDTHFVVSADTSLSRKMNVFAAVKHVAVLL